MNPLSCSRQMHIDRLRLSLLLSARARRRLVERLNAFLSPEAARGSLLVTDLYDAPEKQDLLCQLDLTRHGAKVSSLVVPFEQIALDRRYGFDRIPKRDRRRPEALRSS